MIRLKVPRGDSPEEQRANFERTLKRFRRKVRKVGILRDVFERRYYTKPSERRRLKRKRRQYVTKWKT